MPFLIVTGTNPHNPTIPFGKGASYWHRDCFRWFVRTKVSFVSYLSFEATNVNATFQENKSMFAPIHAPSFIQTVHGLTYKVMRTSQREENEDPQHTKKTNRYENNSPQTPSKPADDQPQS